MKIYISADMEGVSGVVHEDQVLREKREYEYACRLMTGEVNAVIEGAFEAGATEIVVNDAHDEMRNIIPEMLHEGARLIRGSPKPLSMVEGIDETFDAAIFVGYHAAAGSRVGVLGHTYSEVATRIKVNGMTMGEAGINAAVCGYFSVPVVMVSGDSALAAEVKEVLPWAKVLAVKESIVRTAAQCFHPEKVRSMLRTAAHDAILRRKECSPLRLRTPLVLEVELRGSTMADMAALIPGVRRVGPLTVTYSGDDFLEIFKLMRACLIIAGSQAGHGS
ncbi:MAG TPA: M55 family metallopeptidase [Firmicutes bacterium]|nr:M55 family metallopeptidase [Bacillota bacterium]